MPQRPPYEPGEILTSDGVRVLTGPPVDRRGSGAGGHGDGEPDVQVSIAPLPAAMLAVAAGPVLLAAAGGLAALAVAATGAEVARRLLRPWLQQAELPAVSVGPGTVTLTWTQVEMTWSPPR